MIVIGVVMVAVTVWLVVWRVGDARESRRARAGWRNGGDR